MPMDNDFGNDDDVDDDDADDIMMMDETSPEGEADISIVGVVFPSDDSVIPLAVRDIMSCILD